MGIIAAVRALRRHKLIAHSTLFFLFVCVSPLSNIAQFLGGRGGVDRGRSGDGGQDGGNGEGVNFGGLGGRARCCSSGECAATGTITAKTEGVAADQDMLAIWEGVALQADVAEKTWQRGSRRQCGRTGYVGVNM